MSAVQVLPAKAEQEEKVLIHSHTIGDARTRRVLWYADISVMYSVSRQRYICISSATALTVCTIPSTNFQALLDGTGRGSSLEYDVASGACLARRRRCEPRD